MGELPCFACGQSCASAPVIRLAWPMYDSEGPAPIDVRRLRAEARRAADKAAGRAADKAAGSPAGSPAGRAGRGAGAQHARSRGMPRPLVLTAGVVLAVAALTFAAFLGVRWADATAEPAPRAVSGLPVPPSASAASPADPPLTPAPVPARAETVLSRVVHADADWASVLRELDDRRSSAFARAAADGLLKVYVAGSPALREDTADVAHLAAGRLRARGLRMVIGSVQARAAAPGRVLLDVSDRMPPYDIVDREGRVVRREPGRGERSWQVTLVPATDAVGEWRISHIAADRR
jgi:hypothetical protein